MAINFPDGCGEVVAVSSCQWLILNLVCFRLERGLCCLTGLWHDFNETVSTTVLDIIVLNERGGFWLLKISR